MKKLIRKWLYVHRYFRKIVGFLLSLSGRYKPYKFDHFFLYKTIDTTGPSQRDEILFYFGLVKMFRPKVIVEFGFRHGHSSLNFLQAADPDAQVIGIDISDEANQIASEVFSGFSNFKFIHKPQDEVKVSDLGVATIDLLYLDAVALVDMNWNTIEMLLPLISEHGIIMIHDTGTWNKKFMNRTHYNLTEKRPDDWLSDEQFQQQKGQRQLANFILENHPELEVIHLNTQETLRCGVSLVQKKHTLPTEKHQR
jgi:predicted O-methyltransferase YrrM